MTTDKVAVPYIEEKAPDGKLVYTSKQWIDLNNSQKDTKPILTERERKTDTGWTMKKQQVVHHVFFWLKNPDSSADILKLKESKKIFQ